MNDTLQTVVDILVATLAAVIKERDAALAEVARLKAGGCARDQHTTQYCADLEACVRERDAMRAVVDAARSVVSDWGVGGFLQEALNAYDAVKGDGT